MLRWTAWKVFKNMIAPSTRVCKRGQSKKMLSEVQLSGLVQLQGINIPLIEWKGRKRNREKIKIREQCT
ncbi:hypothetical protein SORBI_3005G027350 [Sorghum bicolor]|jgi:hypothetical protein|uniref:Uncharacterized protein n=1 Tax=Sorghum bicolor TaxID=4558 RepID=A0A1Z5RGD8_SORBI|nr:hypothetical protein SORBI_3005G027350 [Sorghum bicolor]